jgi:hypothetical protein
MINAITPTIIKAITRFELWDSGETEVLVLLLRIFLTRMLNIVSLKVAALSVFMSGAFFQVIQAVSYQLLANPFLFTGTSFTISIRNNVQVKYSTSSSDTCRIDQVSAGLLQLVVTEFVFSKLIPLTKVSLPRLR